MKESLHLDDDELEAFHKGDEQVFGKLYDMYRRRLYRRCFDMIGDSQTAEDLVTETMVKLWKSRTQIVSGAHLHNWLYMAAKNHCISYLREKSRKRPVILSSELEIFQHEEETTNFFEILATEIQAEAMISAIKLEIESLPRRCREVCHLYLMEQLSIKQISEKLNIQHSTVYNLRSIGFRYLRKKLNEIIMK